MQVSNDKKEIKNNCGKGFFSTKPDGNALTL